MLADWLSTNSVHLVHSICTLILLDLDSLRLTSFGTGTVYYTTTDGRHLKTLLAILVSSLSSSVLDNCPESGSVHIIHFREGGHI